MPSSSVDPPRYPPLKEAPALGSVAYHQARLASLERPDGTTADEPIDAFIRESGTVVAFIAGGVIVETQRQTGCQSCASRGGCGINLMQKALNRKQHQVRVVTDLPLGLGDYVQLVLPASALVQASLLMYVLPLLGLMIGALAGQMLFLANSASILGGVLGFGLALLWLSRRQNGLFAQGRYAPRVEKIHS
jgi:sigma-E factor negative regulatory protein RseC